MTLQLDRQEVIDLLAFALMATGAVAKDHDITAFIGVPRGIAATIKPKEVKK